MDKEELEQLIINKIKSIIEEDNTLTDLNNQHIRYTTLIQCADAVIKDLDNTLTDKLKLDCDTIANLGTQIHDAIMTNNTVPITKSNSKQLTPRQYMEAERLKKSLKNKRDN